MLDRLNELIVDECFPGRFLTLVHGEIGPGSPARISLACAGQPLPLLLRAPGDSLSVGIACGTGPAAAPALPQAGRCRGRGAPPGAMSRRPRASAANPRGDRGTRLRGADGPLGPGDLLLCVTDGVTRRRDGDRLLDDDDGLARLLAGCAGLPADVVAAKVHEEVRAFGGRPPADGMAVLALRASADLSSLASPVPHRGQDGFATPWAAEGGNGSPWIR